MVIFPFSGQYNKKKPEQCSGFFCRYVPLLV